MRGLARHPFHSEAEVALEGTDQVFGALNPRRETVTAGERNDDRLPIRRHAATITASFGSK
jgi:hypothetical protein